ERLQEIRRATQAIAEGIGVRGLLNVQFAIGQDVLYVLEANPRASRTVPFVSKAFGLSLAKAASLIMVGKSISELKETGVLPATDGLFKPLDHPVAVKEAVLPFKRFRTREGKIVDSVLGPEMRSTGEVMGFDSNFPKAFAKSQAAAYGGLPDEGTVFVSVADRDKRAIILPVLRLQQLGFEILATKGTAEVLSRYGIQTKVVRKQSDEITSDNLQDQRSIVELIEAGEIDMVINTPSGGKARADGYEIRTATVAADRALFTTIAQLGAVVSSIEELRQGFAVRSLQDYAGKITTSA
ncbi:MAG: carbamoyl phosphate synthase large subunit, partial [Cryobacterium sp.]|nr:carbamoyl phosphate synthase large subunit [Cryobacterium sp.]